MKSGVGIAAVVVALLAMTGGVKMRGQGAQPAKSGPQLVWMDTDIGDDIDDAFALGLILKSPEVKLLGVSTAFGDTELRARVTSRFLAATGNAGIPVYAGVHTETSNVMTQAAYGRQWPAKKYGDGVAALLAAAKQHPGQVTLIAIGPLFNVGEAIDRDAEGFRKLKRVVLMGGSVTRGYDGKNGEQRPPEPEWNILQDPKGAEKLLASGVPVYMAPLDSTQIHFEEKDREKLFALGTPLTDQITLLYHQWMGLSWNHSPAPTLFDPVAAAYVLKPEVCPMEPMRIAVDAKGLTTRVEGTPNANVCLKSDEKGFMDLLTGRIEERPAGQ
jgi:inosine-uridine nucleoside N-ribohydrolase